MKPEVSVIVPNYNHAAFLQQRLDSIFNQTYQDFEVILLDDASTDGSQTLLQSYADHPKVSHILLNDKNSGSVFKQWIHGVQLVKGQYLWIAESDDHAEPTFLETTVAAFANRNSLGMVFSDTMKVDADGVHKRLVSQSKKILQELTEEGGIINAQNVTKYLLEKMVIVNASSVLFKREAFHKVDFEVLQKFKSSGDVFAYIGIALNHDILFLPEPLNYMRLHAENTTKKSKKLGVIHQDKVLLLHHYLGAFSDLKSKRDDVVRFFKSNVFFYLDHVAPDVLNALVIKMEAQGFFSRNQCKALNVLFFLYVRFIHHGKPHAMRQCFKYVLKWI